MSKNIVFKNYIFFICVVLMLICVTSCASQGVASYSQQNAEITKETYLIDITFEGGTGKAYIKSPVEVTSVDGEMTAKFVWSSKNYDYMIVNGIKYENENDGGESTFTVDIDNIEEPLTVIGDTVAMSTPHEIEYVITWGEKENSETETITSVAADREAVEKALADAGLSLTEIVPLKYAQCFTIDKYGDYSYITIDNSCDYLVVPEDGAVPEGLPEEVVVLQKPLDNTYLVSTAAMDLINTCGALDMIKLSGTKESDWFIDDAKKAMQDGSIQYAGKYRAPDYELILGSGCNLAIENTMIYHEPAAKAKLEELGIPVLVETSSYESHPLGRLEWIKLYGVLYDKEEEAKRYYDEQLSAIEPIMSDNKSTGKTVAFFHVTANGMINVRKPGDYITKMIELSGGTYALTSMDEEENALSTMNMQMEDFYKEASQADIIIYNSTIGGEITSIDELIDKNELFKDFKAVKEGRVYCTERDLFQQTTGVAEFMKDLNDVLNDVDRDYTYINKLD
ncbi:iron complex transport system substrate-binding protein [Lachnospiraceae bacterium NE2001]|nr:iron complex transport system substrate-binding protein [Lachnospiraceae bacterium NE2001]